MSRFFKLVNMELNRFSKILYGMIISVFIIQVAGLIIQAKGYMDRANDSLMNGIPKEIFIEENGLFGMADYVGSMLFNAPIALCAGAIFLYIFLIWYRDWSGKGSFIYRLLMIPTSRMTIYFSKLTALMLLVLLLVSVQLIFLPIESKILEWFVSAEYLSEISVMSLVNKSFVRILLPQTLTQFILYYGAGFTFLTFLFTAVLLERSFKWKGIILAIVYGVFIVSAFVLPISVIEWLGKTDYFYNSELIMIEIAVGLIVGAFSILLSRYLLNKKITV